MPRFKNYRTLTGVRRGALVLAGRAGLRVQADVGKAGDGRGIYAIHSRTDDNFGQGYFRGGQGDVWRQEDASGSSPWRLWHGLWPSTCLTVPEPRARNLRLHRTLLPLPRPKLLRLTLNRANVYSCRTVRPATVSMRVAEMVPTCGELRLAWAPRPYKASSGEEFRARRCQDLPPFLNEKQRTSRRT